MSLLFTCGEDGCNVHKIDLDAVRIAHGQRKNWARHQNHIRGELPSIEEQNDYFAAAYTRLTEIHLKGNKR